MQYYWYNGMLFCSLPCAFGFVVCFVFAVGGLLLFFCAELLVLSLLNSYVGGDCFVFVLGCWVLLVGSAGKKDGKSNLYHIFCF